MPFVGRDAPLATLAGSLRAATGGEPSRVLISGQSGAGISRLLDELEERLADVPRVLVTRGHATEATATQPYAAVAEALESALHQLPDGRFMEVVSEVAHDLAAVMPGVTGRMDALGIPREAPALRAGGQLGARVVEAIRGTLDRLGKESVAVLALEDLHWADPATRRCVEALLRVHSSAQLCLVLTYHPDELHRRHPNRGFLADLSRAALEHIDLPPLAPDEIAKLAQDRTGERPSADFLAALMEGSGGNPLAADQLLTAHRQLAGLRLSDPFEEILSARLEALSADALRAVRLLAFLRRPLDEPGCLAQALPDGRLTRQALADAVASGLVRAVRRPRGATTDPPSFVIAHERFAEAIETLSLPPERRALHAALARSDALTHAEQAWHWRLAADPGACRRAHLAAAQAASQVDPGETALLHYMAALDLGDAAPEADDPVAELSATLTQATHAAAAAGSFPRAAALARRAIEARPRHARQGADREAQRQESLRRGELYADWGRYRWASGDLGGGLEQMQHALSVMPSAPTRQRAGALATLAQYLMIDARFDESAAVAREAREVARASGAEAEGLLGHATCTLGVDLAYTGQLDEGLALLEEATELARRNGLLDDLMRAYANRTTVLDLDSRREAALAVVNEGIRVASAGGLAETYGAFLRGNAADILFMLGRWGEAEAESRAAMAYRPANAAWFSPILYLGLVLVESRADDEAARLVGQTLLQLEQVPAGQWTALVLRAAVSLLLWGGAPADAVDVASREWHRVLETADPPQIAMAASTALEAAAALAQRARQERDFQGVATAGQLAARALADAEQHLAASRLPPNLGARREADLHLAMARAHRAHLRGRPSAERWGKLAEAWAAVRVPYQQAKARWWEALALLESGDGRAAARGPLLEAWRISGDLPARPLRRALADLARRSRIRLPDADADELARPVSVPLVPSRRVGDVAPRSRVPVGPGRAPTAGESGTDATEQAIEVRLAGLPIDTGAAPFGLSPREMEVLLVLAEGRTNREIAERLFISERTVGVHVRRILSKLEVTGRVQAAGIAIRLGLVAPPQPRVAREPRESIVS